MHRFLLVFALLGLACAITPVSVPRNETAERVPRYETAKRPAFDTVALIGLTFRDERITSRTEASTSSYGWASAMVGGIKGSGNYSGWAQGSSRTYETYENKEWRKVLRLALENARVARRIVDDAPVLIEGLIWNEDRTSAGRWASNVLLTLPTLGLFPLRGTTETTVELRVYLYGELIRTFEGKGRVNWSTVFLNRNYVRRAKGLAGNIAVNDAVSQMAAEAREIAAIVNPGRSAASASGSSPNHWCSRWSDATRLRQCKADQSQAYRHLEPAIERLKWDESSAEAKTLRQCYSEAKFTYGTDWVAVDNCMRSQAAPASRYR